MARITINGYASFEEWKQAGMPGAVSFDAKGERKPDPRRGLCVVDDCPSKVVAYDMCNRHITIWRQAGAA